MYIKENKSTEKKISTNNKVSGKNQAIKNVTD